MKDVSQIFVAIAAEFTGKPAFAQAASSTEKLRKSVERLGRQIGLTFGAAAIINYSKKSVLAAADDIKAQALLEQQLKNLGLAMQNVPVENFIANMEKTTGILDDELRPAFSSLLVATKNVAKSQELMNVAFDTAKARSMSLQEVTTILARAWNGNTKGLKQLGLGYSAAELKSISFLQIQKDLEELYTGAGKAAVDSYAGSVDKLKVSFANAAETIGGSFIESFKAIGGKEGIGGTQTVIQSVADTIAEMITNIGYLIGGLMKFKAIIIPIGLALAAYFLPTLTAITLAVGALSSIGKVFFRPKDSGLVAGQSPGDRAKIDKENVKIAKDAARIAKQQTQALTANTKALKTKSAAEQALDKLKEIFDPQNAQLAAALASAQDDETRARIKSLMVINNNDEAQAKLALSALYTSGALDGLSSALLETIKKILGISFTAPTGTVGKMSDYYGSSDFVQNSIDRLDRLDNANSRTYDYYAANGPIVNISVNPAVAGLIDVIQNSSASGVSPTVSRNESSYMA